MWITNLKCPYYHKLKFFLKKESFNDVTWKFDVPLLSRATIVCKNNPGLMNLNIWTDSIFHEVKFSQK